MSGCAIFIYYAICPRVVGDVRFFRALIDGGEGASFAPGTGYDGGCGQGVFSVGLQGVAEDDVPAGLAKIDRVQSATRPILWALFSC